MTTTLSGWCDVLSKECKRYACRSCEAAGCVHSCHPAAIGQASLLDPPTIESSRVQRDEAMARVDAHADLDWKIEAKRALWARIRTRQPFTTDDLWDDGLRKPREPRALGPVIATAKRKGYLVDTGQMVQSRYRHATKITVWKGSVDG